MGRFIEVTSGIAPPSGLVEAVHTQTEGNPLFVTEVVRLLVQEGELTREKVEERDSWDVRIPEGVREVIGRRLNRLSARCNEALTIASVIGREFELRQLVRLVEDQSEERLMEALEEALSARAIEELPQAVGHYQFTHALIRQTLHDELTTTRRVRVHARILEVLEELYGDEAEAHAVELAHHAAEAEAVLGPERLVHYSLIAGERALVAYAYEEAPAHFQRGMRAKGVPVEGTDPAVDAEAADLLFGLGRAQVATLEFSQMTQAVACLSRAFGYFQGAGDVDRAVATAEEYPVFPVARVPEVTALIEKAMELVPPDSHATGRLLTRYAVNLSVAKGQYEAAREPIERALIIARREGDAALQIRALVDGSRVDGFLMRWEDSLAKSLEAIELLGEVDYPRYEVPARFWATMNLIGNGDLERATEVARSSMATAERMSHRSFLQVACWTNEPVARMRGDWEAARSFADRGLALADQEPAFLFGRALVEYEVGDSDQGQDYLDRMLEVMRVGGLGTGGAVTLGAVAMTIATIARITGDASHVETARAVVDNIRSAQTTFVSGFIGETISAELGLGLIAVAEGDTGLAQEQYALLEGLSLQEFQGWIRASMTVSRVLGLLAHTTGRLDQEAGHFEDALTFCRNGYRPELAWSCCDYADSLLQRNQSGDRQKAKSLLDESLAISSDLGMRPLMERVLSRKMSLQGIDISSPQTSIEAVVSAVEVERPNLQPHAAPDGTVTVMFTDIEGSTAMTERLGDKRAQEVLRTHNALIRQQITAHQGFEVKSQGDGFMVAFSSARRALDCAIAIQQAMAAQQSEESVRVRIGLHTGEAIKEGEDFFGKTVILAARIASQAQGGQVLLSSLLKALVESSGEFAFGDGQEMELKGLAGVHQVFEVNLP